jgi:hypothetical protein
MCVDDANAGAVVWLVRYRSTALDSAGCDDATVKPWAVNCKRSFDELIIIHAGIQELAWGGVVP